METIDKDEQWKLGGDCNKCRRKNYCKKGCKRRRSREESDALLIGARILSKYFNKKG